MKHQLVILCVYRQSGSQKFRVVFEIVLKKKVEIHWGDGCQSVLSAQTGSKIEHYYTTDNPDEWFNIEIFSESPDAMLEFHSESYEFGICAVSFWHCDSLKIIDIKHLSGPYLFACLDLEELYLDYYGNEVLWLPGCPLLKQLQCNFSTTLEVVDLTSSTYLERLEIRHCTRLIEIIGGVRLRNVNHQWTKLSEQTSLNLETIFSKNVKMYRVVALGAVAGEIVDRLRATGNYDDIRFVYCDTDKEHLMSHGKKDDQHILLTDLVQCNKAIHDDCELMAVLVTSLGDELSQKYVPDIIYELWGYADHTYCFAVTPKLEDVTKNEEKCAGLFNWITDHSEITVLQDNSRLPEGLDGNEGIAQLLGLILHHPCKDFSSEREELPFGILVTEEQLYMALNAKYSNNMPEYYKEGTFSFHKSTHEY